MRNDTKLPLRCQRLRKLRKKKGISQKNLSEIIGVTEKVYRSWEKGQPSHKNPLETEYPFPRLDSLFKIADYFECSLDYLTARSDCASVDNEYIRQKTGLSDKAINILSEWEKTGTRSGSKYAWARNSIQAINDLIEQGMFFVNDALEPIAKYCIYRAIFDKTEGQGTERNTAWINCQAALYAATSGFANCVKAVYKKKPSD